MKKWMMNSLVNVKLIWNERSPIAAFHIKNPELSKERLEKSNIIVTHRDAFIRVSPHYYNTEDDVLAIGDVLDS